MKINSDYILWLPSWYPTEITPSNGDFIQRHAQAASQFSSIHVFYVIRDKEYAITKSEKIIEKISGNLTETIVYYVSPNISFRLVDRIVSFLRYWIVSRKHILKLFKLKGPPKIVHVHVIYKAGLIAYWIKRKVMIPFIVTEHWGIYNDIVEDRYRNQPIFVKYCTKNIFRNAIAFHSVSNYLGEAVNKIVIKKDFNVIPNVVDTNLFRFSESPKGKFRFIHVSNMVSLKNVKGIIRVFASVIHKWEWQETIELIIVGEANIDLKNYATKLGVLNTSVIFLNELAYVNVAKEMQKSHTLILFSNIENSPCVIAEGLCCGIPVISTNVGGVSEMLNSDNGILINPGNELGLSNAIVKMVQHYSFFDRIGIAFNAKNKYSYEVIGDSFLKLYNSKIFNK